MIVYRLSKDKYKNDLSGKGAELAGGRWNSEGTALLYTAENRSLCTTEIAVHSQLGIIPLNYYLLIIEIADSILIEEFKFDQLDKNWKTFPHIPATKKIGDEFVLRNQHLVLKVTSAVIQGEFNYLINPKHKKFGGVKLVGHEKFEFDRRLFN